MTLTLRARLAVIATIVSGVLLGGLSVVPYNVLARWLDEDVTTRLTELADGLHGYLRFDGDAPTVEYNTNDSDQASFVHEATRYYQVYDSATGCLLVQSPDIAPLGLSLTRGEIVLLLATSQPSDITTPYGRLRLVNSPIAGPGGRTYLLQVGVSLRTLDASLSRYRDLMLVLTPLSLLLAAAGAWWLSGLALAPLTRAAFAARDIDIATLGRRLPTRGVKDELEDVTLAFNETLGRLERSIGEMRQFSTALAHELRTPLAALRGEIELALRATRDVDLQQSLASQIEDIDRLTRLIEHVLTLARAESGQIPLSFGAVDLGELANSLVETLEPVANARTIALRCEPDPAVVALGDAGWLERLVLNLIDNAMTFTREGGCVIVRVSRHGERACLEVADTGIGMTPAVAAHVFERFYQADPSRSSPSGGAGLGLSLVKWIVNRHHGTVSVESTPEKGSTFRVALPAFTNSHRS
ncbi:MAG TPA: HAMP domain-containing sensor histidine kinase [Vicinamibacterales bacterium]|nr:HAMP domain-containing sensor histidine kinase [Vicinamibacterales bacterium]